MASEGAYSFSEVYTFPIWLRIFIVNKLNQKISAEKKQSDELNQKMKSIRKR